MSTHTQTYFAIPEFTFADFLRFYLLDPDGSITFERRVNDSLIKTRIQVGMSTTRIDIEVSA